MSASDKQLDMELKALAGELSERQRARAGLEGHCTLEELAAAYDIARNPGPYEDMPAALETRIRLAAALNKRDAAAPKRRNGEPTLLGNLAWIAAAAAIVAAIAGWWPRGGEELSTQVAVQQLEATAEEVTKVALSGTKDATVADAFSGEVIWSQSEQRGYMRLAGLAANNPETEQYQLWIIDAERGEYPVDGGVFDVPEPAGENTVPFEAKLAVYQPAAFAITVEQPGGVVVSSQDRVAAIGKVAAPKQTKPEAGGDTGA
ncbi:anti-sigma factor [bacterium]|nr:anti-sigma factor [bacterium]